MEYLYKSFSVMIYFIIKAVGLILIFKLVDKFFLLILQLSHN